jgi:hypothetical protein
MLMTSKVGFRTRSLIAIALLLIGMIVVAAGATVWRLRSDAIDSA